MPATALNIADIVEAALSMPRPERSYLVTKLIGSLDDEDDIEVSPAWQAEIDQRMESIRNGTAKLTAHGEVMTNLRRKLAEQGAAKPA